MSIVPTKIDPVKTLELFSNYPAQWSRSSPWFYYGFAGFTAQRFPIQNIKPETSEVKYYWIGLLSDWTKVIETSQPKDMKAWKSGHSFDTN